jgi:hypothetical protein
MVGKFYMIWQIIHAYLSEFHPQKALEVGGQYVPMLISNYFRISWVRNLFGFYYF